MQFQAEKPQGVYVANQGCARVLLTVKEVASYLKVNQTTIYRLLRKSEIPAFKVGGDWRFDVDRIDEWLRADDRGNDAAARRPRSRSVGKIGEPQKADPLPNSPKGDIWDPAVTLTRLHGAVSQIVESLNELQALLPMLKGIAQALEEPWDSRSGIAGFYNEHGLPILAPAKVPSLSKLSRFFARHPAALSKERERVLARS